MIRVHKLMSVENEHLYGPGKRLLIYLKGCSIHCEGCINQHLWPFEGGTMMNSSDILEICKKERLEGITIHGGEPLDQANGLYDVINAIKDEKYTAILFTGYLKKELNNEQLKVWNISDIVVAGRFKIKKRNVNLQFRGSTNQRVYTHNGLYKDYKIQDGFTTAILTIDAEGNMDVNGFLTEDIAILVGDK